MPINKWVGSYWLRLKPIKLLHVFIHIFLERSLYLIKILITVQFISDWLPAANWHLNVQESSPFLFSLSSWRQFWTLKLPYAEICRLSLLGIGRWLRSWLLCWLLFVLPAWQSYLFICSNYARLLIMILNRLWTWLWRRLWFSLFSKNLIWLGQFQRRHHRLSILLYPISWLNLLTRDEILVGRFKSCHCS